MLRTNGARLAVPLLFGSILVTVALDVHEPDAAAAADGCRPSPSGIICGFSGSTRGGTVTRGTTVRRPTRVPLPPVRYLAVHGGRCWSWSRYRPGYDSWNSAYDQAIILTRWRLPECGRRAAPPPPVVTIDVAARAWSVFRSFPLESPRFFVTPEVGITNLPSRLHLEPVREFTHGERLPDGRRLDVHARVARVWVVWGDGSPTMGSSLGAAVGDPGTVRHTYHLKTCSPDYRVTHLDGPKCHPALDRYPIHVTFEWTARYRTGGGWTELGAIDRRSDRRYDVDEVLGVLADT